MGRPCAESVAPTLRCCAELRPFKGVVSVWVGLVNIEAPLVGAFIFYVARSPVCSHPLADLECSGCPGGCSDGAHGADQITVASTVVSVDSFAKKQVGEPWAHLRLPFCKGAAPHRRRDLFIKGCCDSNSLSMDGRPCPVCGRCRRLVGSAQ